MDVWRPLFFLSLSIFYVQRKHEENLSIRSLNFLQNTASNSVLQFLALCLSVRRLQMTLEGFSLVKTLAKFGIISTTDSLIQNITRILSLSPLIYLYYLKLKTLENHADLREPMFQNQTSLIFCTRLFMSNTKPLTNVSYNYKDYSICSCQFKCRQGSAI